MRNLAIILRIGRCIDRLRALSRAARRRLQFRSTGYFGRRWECYVYINGLHLSAGLHWSPTAGNIEIHVPCAFIRAGRRTDVDQLRGPFGWQFLRHYREQSDFVHKGTGDGANIQGVALLAEPGTDDDVGVRLVLFAMQDEQFVRATTAQRFLSEFAGAP